MAKEINKPTTPERGETKQNLDTQTSKTQADVQIILTEQERREIQQFLNNMAWVHQWSSKTGEKNGAEEIQKEFVSAPAHIRWSKEIIKKLWSMQYRAYDGRGNSLWTSTYNYDHKVINSATSKILDDEEFILELIETTPKIINNLDKTTYLLKKKNFILKALKSIKWKFSWNDKIWARGLWENLDDSLREDQDIIMGALDLCEYRTSCSIKEYLIKHDSPMLDNREVVKKLVLWTWGYSRHLYPEKIRDDDEYILIAYGPEWLWWFYTFDDKFRWFYESFHQKIKEILVKQWWLKEDELFLENIYKLRPELKTYQIKLNPELLQQFSHQNKNNADLSNLKSFDDVTKLMEKYIKRSDTQEMEKLIKYLKAYNNSGLNSICELSIKKFIEDNDIRTIDEKFLALPENTRLLISLYRHNNHSSEDYKDFNFGCGGHGWFKNPTEHEACILWEKNLKRANLRQLAEYTWERCYRIPNQKYLDAKNEIIQKECPDFSNNIKELESLITTYESIQQQCAERNQKKASLNKITKENTEISPEDILNHMPDFVEHISEQKDAAHIQIDIKNKVAAYLEWSVRDSKSAGMEYGNYVAARYNWARKDVHVVYRDAYDPKKDDRSLHFNKVEIKDIATKDDNILVTVNASSDKNSRIYRFDFPLATWETQWLSKEDQEKFTETFESSKKNIMMKQNEKYQSCTMPTYCLPSDMMINGMSLEWETPYTKPTISSECMDKQNWIWAIVIYKQIDHSAGRKRQLARECWLIKADGTYDRIADENMWDQERLSGKQIKMVAQEIVQRIISSK